MDKTNFLDDPSLSNELLQINASVIENNHILNLCMDELSRQEMIAQFMKSHSNSVIDMSKVNLLSQLLTAIPNNFKMENYEKILNLLQRNHELNLIQRHKFNSSEMIQQRTEIQLFNEYMIIKMYLANIIHPTNESIDVSLNHIRCMLKTINDGNVLFQLLQTVFTLIFLRYEHIRKTKFKKRGSDANSGSVSAQNNSHSTEISDSVFLDCTHNGFICDKANLEAILNSMRLFLMSLDVTEAYKNSDTSLREKFSFMLKSVDNALWRLRIIAENSIENSVEKKYSSSEWLTFHEDDEEIISKMTSDEEKEMPKRKVIRKKVKRRSRVLTKSNDENDEDSDNNYHFITESTHTEVSENRIKSLEMHKKCESIIPKVLMKPESLVALCLINNDSKTAEKIIQEYHLEESNINYEFKFIKNYRNALEDLNKIAIKYEAIYESISTINDDCCEIKTFAEAGFEVAKLIDTLDNFCNQNNLKHVEENENLLQKMLSQYPNLWMYQKDFLKIAYLMDFIISLPSQFEFTQNIYKFIIKKFDLEEKEGFFVTFLKKIMEIQTIFQHEGKQMPINKIFNEEIFSLEPSKFKLELANHKNLQWMMEITNDNLDDEPILLEIEQKMQPFKSDVNYINRIVNYVRNIRIMTKFQTNEYFKMNEVLTKLNISKVIGKIIFINQYNPDHVANFAFNSNINLLHSIALVGAGEILPPSNNRKEVRIYSKVA